MKNVPSGKSSAWAGLKKWLSLPLALTWHGSGTLLTVPQQQFICTVLSWSCIPIFGWAPQERMFHGKKETNPSHDHGHRQIKMNEWMISVADSWLTVRGLQGSTCLPSYPSDISGTSTCPTLEKLEDEMTWLRERSTMMGPDSPIMMFCGLRSRWKMPLECRCKTACPI